MKTSYLAVGALALAALTACGSAAATATPPAGSSGAATIVTTAPAAAPTTAAPPTTATSAPAATEAPVAPAGPAPAASTVVVTNVVDGDTIDVTGGQRVRIIGIDTPEKGHCGYGEATTNMGDLVLGKNVVLTAGARDDTDKYGRLLRYVDLPDGTDGGLAQITGGFAIARYDSRDGYGHHPREEQYVAADTGAAARCIGAAAPSSPATTAPAATSAGTAYFANCAAARAAGAAPLHAGDPGYRAGLDRDGDGVACEA